MISLKTNVKMQDRLGRTCLTDMCRLHRLSFISMYSPSITHLTQFCRSTVFSTFGWFFCFDEMSTTRRKKVSSIGSIAVFNLGEYIKRSFIVFCKTVEMSNHSAGESVKRLWALSAAWDKSLNASLRYHLYGLRKTLILCNCWSTRSMLYCNRFNTISMPSVSNINHWGLITHRQHVNNFLLSTSLIFGCMIFACNHKSIFIDIKYCITFIYSLVDYVLRIIVSVWTNGTTNVFCSQ